MLEVRDLRLMGDAAQEKTVGRFLAGQDGQGLAVKIGDHRGGFFCAWRISGPSARRRARAILHDCGSASVNGPSSPLPRKMTTKRWPLPGLMMTWASSAFLILRESNAHSSSRDFCFNPARAAVGDDAFLVERAEIGPGGDVARLEFHAQTEGFNHAAADLKFQRIIAKQSEMAGAAARSDAGGDRNHASLRAVPGQAVEVGGGGGFERGEIILFLGGDVAQSIEHEQCQFGICFDSQMRIKMIQVHIVYGRMPGRIMGTICRCVKPGVLSQFGLECRMRTLRLFHSVIRLP